MRPLEVSGLCKTYHGFRLENISFSLEPGKITGLIGRNGAGKSTTLGCILRFIRPDAGSVRVFGQSFDENEAAVKPRIGYVSGAFQYYKKKKLRAISAAASGFYSMWDAGTYNQLMGRFALEESKTPEQLSAGMRVKYALVLALSHGAELLILDEPTSGLDPFSREDLLELFLDLAETGKTVLFSTHITSDLEKCADNILYIQNGKLLVDKPLAEFVAGETNLETVMLRMEKEASRQ